MPIKEKAANRNKEEINLKIERKSASRTGTLFWKYTRKWRSEFGKHTRRIKAQIEWYHLLRSHHKDW